MKSILKFISSLLVVLLILETGAWASPAGPSGIRFAANQEVPLSSLVETLEIPESLGSIGTREAASTSAPSIVHIQEAHNLYEGQLRVEEILKYLGEHYPVDLLLVEGAFDKLDGRLIKFYQTKKDNEKMTEHLTREGFLGGVERYLLGRVLEGVEPLPSYGIEETGLYKKNLSQFRQAHQGMPEAELYVETIGRKLQTEVSKTFSPELRRIFQQYQFFEEHRDDPGALLEFLGKAARKHLGLNFRNPRLQFEWPQIVRYFRIKHLEQLLDERKAGSEKESFLTWLKEKEISEKFTACLENENAACFETVSGRKGFGSVRLFYERLYEAIAPLGFKFATYPEFSRLTAVRILANEIISEKFFGEIEMLSQKLLGKLAASEEERDLLSQYEDYRLLRKLAALELTPEEWEKVKGRERIPALEPNYAFYETAVERDTVMAARIRERLQETGKSNVVLVTGGFHTYGLERLLTAQGYSYLNILPSLTNLDDKTDYEKTMTAKVSQLRSLSLAMGRAELRNIDPPLADRLDQTLRLSRAEVRTNDQDDYDFNDDDDYKLDGSDFYFIYDYDEELDRPNFYPIDEEPAMAGQTPSPNPSSEKSLFEKWIPEKFQPAVKKALAILILTSAISALPTFLWVMGGNPFPSNTKIASYEDVVHISRDGLEARSHSWDDDALQWLGNQQMTHAEIKSFLRDLGIHIRGGGKSAPTAHGISAGWTQTELMQAFYSRKQFYQNFYRNSQFDPKKAGLKTEWRYQLSDVEDKAKSIQADRVMALYMAEEMGLFTLSQSFFSIKSSELDALVESKISVFDLYLQLKLTLDWALIYRSEHDGRFPANLTELYRDMNGKPAARGIELTIPAKAFTKEERALLRSESRPDDESDTLPNGKLSRLDRLSDDIVSVAAIFLFFAAVAGVGLGISAGMHYLKEGHLRAYPETPVASAEKVKAIATAGFGSKSWGPEVYDWVASQSMTEYEVDRLFDRLEDYFAPRPYNVHTAASAPHVPYRFKGNEDWTELEFVQAAQARMSLYDYDSSSWLVPVGNIPYFIENTENKHLLKNAAYTTPAALADVVFIENYYQRRHGLPSLKADELEAIVREGLTIAEVDQKLAKRVREISEERASEKREARSEARTKPAELAAEISRALFGTEQSPESLLLKEILAKILTEGVSASTYDALNGTISELGDSIAPSLRKKLTELNDLIREVEVWNEFGMHETLSLGDKSATVIEINVPEYRDVTVLQSPQVVLKYEGWIHVLNFEKPIKNILGRSITFHGVKQYPIPPFGGIYGLVNRFLRFAGVAPSFTYKADLSVSRFPDIGYVVHNGDFTLGSDNIARSEARVAPQAEALQVFDTPKTLEGYVTRWGVVKVAVLAVAVLTLIGPLGRAGEALAAPAEPVVTRITGVETPERAAQQLAANPAAQSLWDAVAQQTEKIAPLLIAGDANQSELRSAFEVILPLLYRNHAKFVPGILTEDQTGTIAVREHWKQYLTENAPELAGTLEKSLVIGEPAFVSTRIEGARAAIVTLGGPVDFYLGQDSEYVVYGHEALDGRVTGKRVAGATLLETVHALLSGLPSTSLRQDTADGLVRWDSLASAHSAASAIEALKAALIVAVMA